MQKLAIIGAGISGLSTAHFLKDHLECTIFEKESKPGGLIRCERINGNLFHTCGGHVFNSKRQDVLNWFWSSFKQDSEFTKTSRNSIVYFEGMEKGKIIPYPIENHIYMFDDATQKSFYQDLEDIDNMKGEDANISDYTDFGDFLRWRFGKTLYDIYFEPYNHKIWRRDLSTVPMSWMEGKLPMPTTVEMRNNNKNRIKEKKFVHSTFWYENVDGSQYIANVLAKGLNIVYNTNVTSIKNVKGKWVIQDKEFDKVIFCGNIKDMVRMLSGIDLSKYSQEIENLEYHGTTSVFCEIDANPYSWIYLPSNRYESHRIICTGNFAESNNANLPKGRISATVEFTDLISKDEIIANLSQLPFNPRYITHKYNQYTYPIQSSSTRFVINKIKEELAQKNFYFTGRFADWEYYNMDIAIGSSLDLCSKIKGEI